MKALLYLLAREWSGTYLAEMDGSIIAVYHDNRATLNSRDLNSNSDDVWIANESKMPPKNLPVLVRFHCRNWTDFTLNNSSP